jgi:hypothetical protein
MAIRLATPSDIPQIMALEARNYVGNLDESRRADGFISILHSREWFTSAVDSAGVHVATADDATIIGFIAITNPPSKPEPTSPPILKSMLELVATLDFNGAPIAQQRYAFRGPVLVDPDARGRGIYSAFNEVTHEAYADRFDIGVLFVAADNHRSVHTTTTKLGAESLAIFEVGGSQYHFMAFAF